MSIYGTYIQESYNKVSLDALYESMVNECNTLDKLLFVNEISIEDVKSKFKKIIDKIKSILKAIVEKGKRAIKNIISKVGTSVDNVSTHIKGENNFKVSINFDDDFFDESAIIKEARITSTDSLKESIEAMCDNPFVFIDYSRYIKFDLISSFIPKFTRSIISNIDNIEDTNEEFDKLIDDYNEFIMNLMNKQFTLAKASYISADNVCMQVMANIKFDIKSRYDKKSMQYSDLVNLIKANYNDNKSLLSSTLEKCTYRVNQGLDDIREPIYERKKYDGRYLRAIKCFQTLSMILVEIEKSIISATSRQAAVLKFVAHNEG